MEVKRRVRVMQYTCLRCDHTWIGRKAAMPMTCAKCRNPYWNIPRVRPIPPKKEAVCDASQARPET